MRKKINQYAAISLLALSSLFAGCTEGFEEMNTNPKTIPFIQPEGLFYTAEIQALTSGHCWNAIYASKYRWMQYGAGIWGYGTSQYSYFREEIGNTVYNEYNEMGGQITAIEHLIAKSGTPERYSDLVQMGRILLIAKGIQTSDLYGSLIYSNGWMARKDIVDDESMSPAFETQEELSDVWDKQLKDCIANLKAKLSATDKASTAGYDRAYNGETGRWIKAANALRLRLASRLWKRKPETAKSIATEVLAPSNAENLFASNDDSFILWFDKLYTNIHSGDWHSVRDMEIATYCIMDYLNENDDPRRRMYFVINNLTPENIAAFNADVTDSTQLLPLDYGRWEGSTASYDKFSADRRRTRLYLRPPVGSQIDMRPANMPQVRLWKGNDNDGNGANWAPIMTFADFCFLAAEFTLRENIPSAKTPQQWYETGVKASLDQWNFLGSYCDIANYEAMTDAEKAAFLAKPNIKWDPVRALEQIYAQTYIEHYKNVDEAWAFWKRTDYPNSTSNILRFETPVIEKLSRIVPRRVKFSYPNEGVHNYANLKKRLDDMAKDPQFGAIDDEFGRHWWDAK